MRPGEVCEQFYREIGDFLAPYGWKYLKSTHEAKKQINDIVCEVMMGASWNNDETSARVRIFFLMWSKNISKKYSAYANVLSFQFAPLSGRDDEWWELMGEGSYERCVADAKAKIEASVIPLVDEFEDNALKAVEKYAIDPYINDYAVRDRKVYPRIVYISKTLGNRLAQQSYKQRYDSDEFLRIRAKKDAQSYIDNMEKAKRYRSNGAWWVSIDIMHMIDESIIALDENGEIIFPPIDSQ